MDDDNENERQDQHVYDSTSAAAKNQNSAATICPISKNTTENSSSSSEIGHTKRTTAEKTLGEKQRIRVKSEKAFAQKETPTQPGSGGKQNTHEGLGVVSTTLEAAGAISSWFSRVSDAFDKAGSNNSKAQQKEGESVEKLFERLGMSAYVDAFLAQDIRFTSELMPLTSSDMTQLLPKLGPRRRLERWITEQKVPDL
mmetsp:Transcript_47906/g.94073  ORF Transcript_47906/g.94073 Transcript_47906/m.94073 type:complete len:198 (-) Transcript_47906:19-612(-)